MRDATAEQKPRAMQGALRAMLILAVLEGAAYFAAFLFVATRLAAGGTTATVHATVTIAGVSLFVAERMGNTSTITPAGWMGIALVLIPVLGAAATYLLCSRQSPVLRVSRG
jgi:hypothetical protein